MIRITARKENSLSPRDPLHALRLLGGGVLRAALLAAAGLPLLSLTGQGYWPWAGGVEVGAASLIGLFSLGFGLLAFCGDGRVRALLSPAPALLIGSGLLGAALSPLWAEPARALFGHPAIGFGGLWLLLAGLISGAALTVPAGRFRRVLIGLLLAGGLFGLIGAVRLGAHAAALPLLLIGLVPLLPASSRPAPSGAIVALTVALGLTLTAWGVAPTLRSADRLLGPNELLIGSGWGSWHELTGTMPVGPLVAMPGAGGTADPLLPGHPGGGADGAGVMTAGLPAGGAARLTTGSVLGELLVGLGLAGGALLLLSGLRLIRGGTGPGRFAPLIGPLAVLSALPPTLALAPIAGLLLAGPGRDGWPPLPRAGRLLTAPALALAMGGATVGSALVRTAEFAAHDRLLPPRFLERADSCIATRSALIPERDVHVALQRLLIGRILTAEDPYAAVLRQQSVLASGGCILEQHLKDRPGPLILEARLEMRGAIMAVNRHLAETGSDAPPLEPQLDAWAEDLADLLQRAPARTDLLDAFLAAASGPEGAGPLNGLRERLIAAGDPALAPIADRLRAGATTPEVRTP